MYKRQAQEPPRDSFGPEPVSQSGSLEQHSGDEGQTLRRERLDMPAHSPIGRTRTPIGRPIYKGICVALTPAKRDSPASLDPGDHTDRVRVAVDDQPPPATPRDLELIFPPPPQQLVDSHGGQRFHVERILNRRDVKRQRTSYLVRWCGYPPSHDSWGPLSQLMIDVEGLVYQYDETHPMAQTGHRKTRTHGAGRAIAG